MNDIQRGVVRERRYEHIPSPFMGEGRVRVHKVIRPHLSPPPSRGRDFGIASLEESCRT